MNKNLKFYLLLINLLMYSNTYAMKREVPPTEIPPAKKQKLNKNCPIMPIKTEIPATIKHNPTELKSHIIDFCKEKSKKIDLLEKYFLENFKKVCGLIPDNWDHFEKNTKIIQQFYKNKLSPTPENFQPYITSHIPAYMITKLRNNLTNNGILFDKVNIFTSGENIRGIIKPDTDNFSTKMPLYPPSIENPKKFIFEPDEIIINYTNYAQHVDFFNACIVVAFAQEITRIVNMFFIVSQQQVVQQVYIATQSLRPVDFSKYYANQQALEEPINIFIKNYGFKIGIFRLALKNKRLAHLFMHYITYHEQLCNQFGITKNDFLFLYSIDQIDSLKDILHNSEHESSQFLQSYELNPECLYDNI